MSDYPSAARDTNFYLTDRALQRQLTRRAPELPARHGDRLAHAGAWAGDALDRQAEYTDRFAPPRLEAYGADGRPISRVVFNPDYLGCHAEAYRRGAVGLPYTAEGQGRHAVCFVMGYLMVQADISIHCPVTMTGAVAHVLATLAPADLRDAFLPDLIRMDGGALSGGTWATELHGGSDVGATTSRALPAADAGAGAFRLHGVKWFTSNAGAGLALATARPDGAAPGGRGLGCYLVPSHLPDGTANRHRIRRLKEKAGTRGLATAELDLDGTLAFQVAAPPDGLKAMLAALEYSRIHNAVGAAGLHRRALVEAAGWAARRVAFGRPIDAYPMVRDQLLDLQMEQEAGLAMALEAALAFDAVHADGAGEEAADWLRLATALAKYRTAEQAVRACTHAVEIVGGNGYTEEWPTARLYRDSLVTAIWEGPANIQALELLRLVASRRPGDRLFLDRIAVALGALPAAAAGLADRLGAALTQCREALAFVRARPEAGERHGRRLLDLLADTLALALLAEEAAAELPAGNRRGLLVADRLGASLFGARHGLGEADDPAQRAYAAFLAGEPV